MSLPKIIADTLVRKGLATYTSPAKSTLADGTVKDVDVIIINQITVDGRVLQDVVAASGGGKEAPVLLGLGALNRLGKFNIDNGKIVFTGGQPI
jgi:predicted aspartyl protease